MKKFYKQPAAVLMATALMCTSASCGLEITDKDIDSVGDAVESAADGIKDGISAVGSAADDIKAGIDAVGETAGEIKAGIDDAQAATEEIQDNCEAIMALIRRDSEEEAKMEESEGLSSSSDSSNGALLDSVEDIQIVSTDGGTKNYTFVYDEESFSAIHTTDHWKIVDSYKINNGSDMRIICQALINLFPVHGSDMKSYRTAEDMTYEWQQHNLAYMVIGDESEWSSHLKDVDFDPYDQGKSIDEIYEDRTGKEFNLKDFF